MMDNYKTVTWEQFIETYKPIENTFEANAPLDGYMLEIYGAELDYVRAAFVNDPATVWTYVDGDSEYPIVTSGFHFVNRIGYVVTELPAEAGMFIDVIEN